MVNSKTQKNCRFQSQSIVNVLDGEVTLGNSLSTHSFSLLIMFALYFITDWIMQEKRSDTQVTVAHHPWGSYHGQIYLPLQRCWKKINLWSVNMITILCDGYNNALGTESVRMALVCRGSAGNEIRSGNLTFRVVVVGLSRDGLLWDVLRDSLAFFDTRKESIGGGCGAEWMMSFT